MSKKTTANPSKLSREEIERLARAYVKGVDVARTRTGQEMARAQAERVHREFRKLQRKIHVEFTERDPYASFEELRADVLGNKRMFVYTLHSETPLWDEQTNWMARAVHDYDHVLANTDFTVDGEVQTFQVSAERAPSLEPLYLSEIALQAASSAVLGAFPSGPQKLVLTGPEVTKVARTFRRNTPDEATAWTVWDAAGALRYMTPEELMMRLAPKSTYEEALLVVLAAEKLDG